MALYADVTFDSRVQREADTLSGAGHEVTIYCLSGTAPPGARYTVVAHRPGRSSVLPDGSSPFLKQTDGPLWARLARRIEWVFGYLRNVRAWGRWAVSSAGEADVWHAHDLTGLMAVGPVVRTHARLVYDSHEIFVETGTAARLPRPLRRILSAYEGRLARRAVALVTVNERYGEVLKRRIRPRRTLIVRNCPPRWTPPSEPSSQLRVAAGVPAPKPLILYHGAFARHRGIEQAAEAILEPGLETAHLALLGFGGIRPELEALVRDPRFGGRLHLVDAVAPGDLLEWVSGADVDVIPLQHSTLNHYLCTPNKLWESLACGVPVVVSDFPSMRPVVLDEPAGPLGAVCDPADPSSIAMAIRALVDMPAAQRVALRARCLEVAHSRWNWETESAKLLELYAGLHAEA
jgi:glycosyltransferase involved in cell wall biosynthesis